MKKLTLLLCLFAVGCADLRSIGKAISLPPRLVVDTFRGLLNPDFVRNEYTALLERNRCPAGSLNQDVFAQTCKLNPKDEVTMEKWRQEGVPPDCNNRFDPHDPCWEHEKIRHQQWLQVHVKEIK